MKKNNYLGFYFFIGFIPLIILIIAFFSSLNSQPLIDNPFENEFAVDSEVKRLKDELKYSEALKRVIKLKEDAYKKGDVRSYTFYLIEEFRLKTALHSYEKSLKDLLTAKKPEHPLAKTILTLYEAQAISNYLDIYLDEISRREKVTEKDEFDFDKYTKDELYETIKEKYLKAFNERSKLESIPIYMVRDFIHPGDYPGGVISSLREFLTISTTSLLASNINRKTLPSNNVYTIPIQTLLDRETLSANLDNYLKDTKTNPLLLLCSIYSFEEKHSLKSGKKATALEYHIRRSEAIFNNITNKENRKRVIEELKKSAEDFEDISWYSSALAQIAHFEMAMDDEDRYVRAKEIAMKGYNKYPNSVSGKRCKSILSEIEEPDFELENMNCDGRGYPSIKIRYKNINKVYLKFFPIDIEKAILKFKEIPKWNEMFDMVKKSTPEREFEICLEESADYDFHNYYFTCPTDLKKGCYVITLSNQKSLTQSNNKVKGNLITITDMSVLSFKNKRGKEVEYYFALGENFEPISDVDVKIVAVGWDKASETIFNGKSDKNGRININFKNFASNYRNKFLFAQKDDNKIFLNIREPYDYSKYESQEALIFTDRSIYRANQKIFFKIVAFSNSPSKGPNILLKEKWVDVSLYDANDEVVQLVKVKTNEFGSASGEFLIPEGRALGQWRIVSSLGSQSNVRVEEYKRPTFEVEIKEPASEMRLNSEVTILGKANYYFGMPVNRGSFDYTVERKPNFPWWFFNFYKPTKPEIISQGGGIIKEDGSFEIRFKPDADENLKEEKGIYYSYRVTVNVTDEGGETASDTKTFNIGFTSNLPKISQKKNFFVEKEDCEFEISLSDLNATPKEGVLTYTLYLLKTPEKIEKPSQFKQEKKGKYILEGDKIEARWDYSYDLKRFLSKLKEDKVVKVGKIKCDKNGSTLLKIPDLNRGIYRLKVETTEIQGVSSFDFNDFIVFGENFSPNIPLILLSEKDEYQVGEKVKLLTYCGYEETIPMIRGFNKEGIFYDNKFSLKKLSLSELEITEEMRGAVIFEAIFINEFCLFKERVKLSIPYSNKELKIEFEKFRDKITPSLKEIWRVKIKDPNGKPVNKGIVELLASMYDISLDIFEKHKFPSFLTYFPKCFNPSISSDSIEIGMNLFTYNFNFYNILPYPSFNDPYLISYDGYGIGGPGRRRYFAREKGIIGGIYAGTLGGIVSSPEEMTQEEAELSESKTNVVREENQPTKAELRENFQETAFFYPHLISENDGSVAIEFVPPDSLTAYRLMLFAHSDGLLSGYTEKLCKASKDFMIRPYLPRFLREGDEITLKVMANNATNTKQNAKIYFKVFDEATEKEITSQFLIDSSEKTILVKEKGSETTSFNIKVPKKVGLIKIEVGGICNNFTDGERRNLPILPSRIHLSESKFISLKENSQREIIFDDLISGKDKTRINELFVLTVDAQLLYSIIEAMPYIIEYPYECNEQLVNKFVTVGILDKIISDNPMLKELFYEFSQRKTPLESFDKDDPNRRMSLEETPWLNEAKGGKSDYPILNVLNPANTSEIKQSSLKKLLESQDSSGGWAWFSGGRPSFYITLYILYSFSKASEFGVDIPNEPIKRGFQFLKREGLKEDIESMMDQNVGYEFITFLNYTLSNFSDEAYYKDTFSKDLRKRMADFSFKHWKKHSPYLKLQLALTLKRMGREKEAKLVHETVFDSAITKEDEGTFWAIEDKSWLWYNDTVETQAFALKELMEINPKDEKAEGLLLWLYLNKKLNHWKSTKATSEALYSILSYLKSKGEVTAEESIKIDVGDSYSKSLVYEPSKYTGKKNQIVFENEEIKPDMGKIKIKKDGKGFAFASATLHFSTEEAPKESRGDFFNIERSFYKRVAKDNEFVLIPITEGTLISVGDEIEVELRIKSKEEAEYIHILAPRPSGFEPVKFKSGWSYSLGISYYEVIRDSKEDFFIETLPKGEFKLRYRIRCFHSGIFRVAPATIESMYAPEFKAYSSSITLKVVEKE